MLYLDYCSSTPMHPQVIQVITDIMGKYYGNPSSLHRIGMEAERLLKQSRQVIASSLRCNPNEVIFTSGGTESNNLAIKGTAFARERQGKHLITSQIEHASVLDPFKQLESFGFRVTYLPVDATGLIHLEDVRNALQEDTILVSLMHVNNEVGRIQPIQEIGQLLSNYPKVTFHVDAIQSMGKLACIPQHLGADLLSISAHKLSGPKGAGVLYRREGIQLQPQLTGGGQEFGIRSGTENVPLIAGMAKALRMAVDQQPTDRITLYGLRERLLQCLGEIEGLTITGSKQKEDMAPQIVHFCIPGMRAEVILHALEQHEIYISTRSACASGKEQPSHVLLAMGKDREYAKSGLRVSYSANQTFAEIDFFADCLRQVVQQLQLPKKKVKR
jgi:cysteine desulfurase